jgi:hypothetical protein
MKLKKFPIIKFGKIVGYQHFTRGGKLVRTTKGE